MSRPVYNYTPWSSNHYRAAAQQGLQVLRQWLARTGAQQSRPKANEPPHCLRPTWGQTDPGTQRAHWACQAQQPVAASATTYDGNVCQQGRIITGSSSLWRLGNAQVALGCLSIGVGKQAKSCPWVSARKQEPNELTNE